MRTVTEMTKIESRGGLWLVLVLSPIGKWVAQGEHLTRAGAEQDLRNWR